MYLKSGSNFRLLGSTFDIFQMTMSLLTQFSGYWVQQKATTEQFCDFISEAILCFNVVLEQRYQSNIFALVKPPSGNNIWDSINFRANAESVSEPQGFATMIDIHNLLGHSETQAEYASHLMNSNKKLEKLILLVYKESDPSKIFSKMLPVALLFQLLLFLAKGSKFVGSHSY